MEDNAEPECSEVNGDGTDPLFVTVEEDEDECEEWDLGGGIKFSGEEELGSSKPSTSISSQCSSSLMAVNSLLSLSENLYLSCWFGEASLLLKFELFPNPSSSTKVFALSLLLLLSK